MRNDSTSGGSALNGDFKERDLFYKIIVDLKKEVNDLKTVVHDIIVNSGGTVNMIPKEDVIFHNDEHNGSNGTITIHKPVVQNANTGQTIEVEETLSLMDKEKDMIKKALRKHKGKRKYAAKELGISERTLYRKINEYNIVE